MSLKILDLFCCAGGTSVGYGRAFPNAEIVGVDHQYQIRYPFRFIWDDALEFCRRYGMDFDLIHASPPCQFASAITPHQARSRHRNLIPATRNTILMTRPKAYVIENVENAKGHLIHPITLCGTQFGLKVYRHRCFEVFPQIQAPKHFSHHDQMPSCNRGKLPDNLSPKGFITVVGGGSYLKSTGRRDIFEYRCQAMDIHWMNRYEICQAIPPAYTEYIGQQIKAQLAQSSTN